MGKKVLIMLLLSLLLLSGCSIIQFKQPEQRSSSEEIVSKPESAMPVDLIIMVDQSGSMNGAMGEPATDPKGLRIEAVKYFIDNYSTKSDKQNPNRIGVINFGSNAYEVFPLTEVSVDDQEKINTLTSKIKPLNLGSTSFINALKLAKEMFAINNAFNGNRLTSIVIFTDGEPYDSRRLNTSDYFNEIENYIKNSFPSECQIFLVGIDDAQKTWSKSLPYWKQFIPSDRIFKIDQMESLRFAFNDIIRQIFHIPDVPPDVVGNTQKSFLVPPYIDTLELHAFFNRKNGELKVYDPSGKIVDFQKTKGCTKIDKGSYMLYLISSPQAGEWSYKMDGATGTVEVYKNFIPVKISLFAPTSPFPTNKKTRIYIEFIKKDGSEIISDPKYPLRIAISIFDNKNSKIFSDILESVGSGVYVTNKIFEPKNNGLYRLEFEVAGGTEYSFSYVKEIKVEENPYLEPVFPSYGSQIPINKNIPVEVILKVGGRSVNPNEIFQTSELLLVRAQLSNIKLDLTNTKEIPKVYWLNPLPNKNGAFSFVLPFENPKEGNYTLLVELKGKLKSSGSTYSDLLILDFAMKPSLLQQISKYIKYLLVFVFLIWLIQWVVFALNRKSKNKEIMDINIYFIDKDGNKIDLYSKTLRKGRFFFIPIQNKRTKNLYDLPRGFMFLSAKDNTTLSFSFFKNKIEYFLFPLIITNLRKRNIVRGLEENVNKNIFIKVA